MGILKRVIPILLIIICCISPVAAAELIPGGQVIGLRLEDGSVYIAGFDPELGACARQAGLKAGDRLLSADSKTITCPQDLRDALEASHGTVALTVLRSGKTKKLRLSPAVTAEGPRLGVYLRQGISGLGTVTYYKTDGSFGALGHGVNQGSNQLLQITEGTAFRSAVVAVRKGKAGEPGQLMGGSSIADTLGILQKNTPQGVFGKAHQDFSGQKMETAPWDQIKTGPATILSTVSGTEVREYSVEILKIYPNKNPTGRNFLIRVTDPALLETTGGIVQGMSGSPIIQNGKLIGAVTHVLVNDPTTGYGIFIENMLDAAA
jgi:stage IV sporulation protein B